MDLRIVKYNAKVLGVKYKEHYCLEKTTSKSDIADVSNVPCYRLFLYDVTTNAQTEIAPEIKKYEFAKITNISANERFVYFTGCSYDEDNNKRVCIHIYRYNIEDNSVELLHSIDDEIELYNSEKRIHLFILNDLYMIIQFELLRSNMADNYEGFFDFEQFLLGTKDKVYVKIIDENINNNGIAKMIKINENQCIIKTGFTLFKEQRYEKLDKNEVSVENICFVNIGQLISDILLQQKNIVMDIVDQTYYTCTIPKIDIVNDYLIYSKLNLINFSEEIIFYNYVTKATHNLINQNIKNVESLAKTYIINDKPYVRLDKKESIEFVNIDTTKADIKFSSSVIINEVLNNMIIVSTKKKKLFKQEYKTTVKIFNYPGLSLLHEEKGEYIGHIMTTGDIFYVFVK